MNFPPHVQTYFNDHKISQQVLNDFQVGWNGSHIVFPVLNNEGKKLFSIYRRDPASETGPKFLYEKGSHVSLYGIHKIKNEPSLVICEGLSDCLCCWSAGIPAITSTGGALSFQKEWQSLLCDKQIIILLDGDEAGGKGAAKILDILPNAKVCFVPDKKGIKDISNFVANGGDLKKLLETARHFNTLEEVKNDYYKRIALIQPVWFHKTWMSNHPEFPQEETKMSKRTGDELSCAKQHPIHEFIKFGQNQKASCIFHSEKTSSMHYYKEKNRIFCFGCGKSADAVDVYMQLHNCSFLEAVRALQNS